MSMANLVAFIQVDILLNNAGLALGTAKVHENSIEVLHVAILMGIHLLYRCKDHLQDQLQSFHGSNCVWCSASASQCICVCHSIHMCARQAKPMTLAHDNPFLNKDAASL